MVGETAVADGTHAQRVYLLNRKGLYRSDDGGADWSLATKTIYTSSKQVLVDPANPDVVYTMGTCVYRSTDGGHTLVAFKGAPGGDDPNQWWIDPSDPQHIVYGGDQGASVSLDGGSSWSPWYNQKTAEIYKITTDNRFPYWIYGSKQDSGAFAIASRGLFGQITDLDWFPLPGWETGFVTIDPADPDVLFRSGTWASCRNSIAGPGARRASILAWAPSAPSAIRIFGARFLPPSCFRRKLPTACITAPRTSGRAGTVAITGRRSVRT